VWITKGFKLGTYASEMQASTTCASYMTCSYYMSLELYCGVISTLVKACRLRKPSESVGLKLVLYGDFMLVFIDAKTPHSLHTLRKN